MSLGLRCEAKTNPARAGAVVTMANSRVPVNKPIANVIRLMVPSEILSIPAETSLPVFFVTPA
ncbi:hypothetical protein [Dehalogenimonas etheniformans]|uniref:hypothetical protein n=1 Tax=Dehalogenimonas etheniformans TaxID=1536648 RepID=UPI0013922CD8|nr:hypothetical protein [Dehalogenimonas etheniformans]QNT76355.1 hypothetical protein HX448_06470 [Dehalogenimonas etheniformans]